MVIDTNVIVAGLYSNKGASFKLLSLLGKNDIQIAISVSLVLEYEEVLMRNLKKFGLAQSDIIDFLDYFCAIANKRKIYFLWRPFLRNPKDDLVLELAVESESEYIVTYNLKDFQNIEHFGITALTPHSMIKIMENKI